MKQLLQNLRNGETTVVDVPVPAPGPKQVLVHTRFSLISAGTERMVVDFASKSLLGKARSRPDLLRQVVDKALNEGIVSTLESALNRLDKPMPLGYSSAGVIVALGEEITDLQVGQRVACAGGGFAVHAEFVKVPRSLVVPLPENIDFESAAFTTLGAIAMHGFRLTEAQVGENVAVIGLGLLGLLAAMIAQAAGCNVLGIDIKQRQVDLAKTLGIEAVLRDNAEKAAIAFSDGAGCDNVLICADTPSSDPIELAGEIARDRARVIVSGAVGLQIPRKIYYEKELTLINSRSYGPGRYDSTYEEEGVDYPIGYIRWTEGRNLQAFVKLLSSGKINIKLLVTHKFPIDKAPDAYKLILEAAQEEVVAVLLTYPETEENITVTKPKRIDRENFNLTGAAAQKPKEIKLGVLGAGNFATVVMLPALSRIEHVNLIGIASQSGANAQYAAKRFKFQYATSDENRIIEDAAINTVAILTRHNLHARQILASLASGKHTFCEKPLAMTEEELDEIEAVFKDNNGDKVFPYFMVGFNRRFAPLAKKLAAFINERKEPFYAHYRINAGYLPKDHWTQKMNQGGGRIIGEGCHFIDFLTFLADSAPVSVFAQTLPNQGHYNNDNAVMTFDFPDGSIGVVSYLANGDKAFPKERVEVFSAGRIAILDDFRKLETIYKGKKKVYKSRTKQDKGHKAEWEIFANAIINGDAPPIPYDQLFGVTRATFKALESIKTGTKVKIE